jgi:serine/threonine protein phosphatase PrpC
MMKITKETAQGKRSYQEDRLVVKELEEGTLLAVFDGHGGANTACLCKDNCAKFWQRTDKKLSPMTRLTQLFGALDKLTAEERAGSTASVVFIPTFEPFKYAYPNIFIATLGDSPVIWKDYKGDIKQAAEHNVATNKRECAAAVKRGGIYDGHTYIWNDRGPYSDLGVGLQMSRSFGDKLLRGVVIQKPTVRSSCIALDGWIVVATDGISRSHGSLKKYVGEKMAAGADATDFVQLALAVPTRDNVTAITVRWK